ncbi:MAG: DHA2 family efflux MFS transporter permease subunit [bacterium]
MSEAKNDNLKWIILLTVIIGTFLGRLDQTIVNLALPKMMMDFSINTSSAGWIATAYIIANAIFVPIWGKLGDTIGRKKVYILGFSLFIVGSILAAMSWNFSSMIFFRIIQAIAGSADYPTAMAIIAVTFKQGRDRAQALGIWSSSFAAASVFGPLLGGPLIDNFGWRSVFWINLPIGIIGIIMASTYIRESIGEKVRKAFDFAGAITLGICLTALVLVLDQGQSWGWMSAYSLISYLVALSFLLLFIFLEKRAADPIVDLKFFKNSLFVNTVINNFVIFMGMMGSVFLIPLFAQTYLGYDATQTGYLFMPMAFVMVISSFIGGRYTQNFKPGYVIFVSTFIAGIGLYLFSFLDVRSGAVDILYPLSIMAFGMGLGMSQRTSLIASAVPQQEIGVASSVLALARNIAGAFGIAIFSTILSSSIGSSILNIAGRSTLNIKNSDNYKEFTALIISKAQIVAYGKVFVISSVVVMIGAFLALLIKVKKIKKEVEVVVE